ncbi:oxidoreductase domain protein [Beutenbergia cavernae DSM 12333]|uniref:Oxidoreductase domain protein n=1 Tax=Beutenbergia cavernae (strain ATCC BAA-8 / DSM 12333 / CCUG 43141 / JCM 11478 / NBRC 16432 / NCIMB 13614 / HKI 0122) TaxID=471853 RepID=C5C1E8_BEUC1|nr:Gfo/Idh/MocA family oxidoreductase [Beutenbergia cavernae]ACQ81558.1 oxidoreductase domain protein [Beutenbergia cavernae DSM 12333]
MSTPSTSAGPTRDDGAASPAPLKLAIVGCGVIGRLHAEVAAASPDLEVVAVVDPHPERAGEVAAVLTAAGEREPRSHGDLGEALAAGDVDVVAVCVPSGEHAEIAIQALEAGAHVVVEKPLDVALPPARRLREASAQRPGQVVAVISQHRHDYSSLAVHRALEAGRFGRVTSAVANIDWYRTQEYYDSGDWRGTWALDGGGALMNQGVHTLDLLLWFLGEPIDVVAHTARLGHERIEVEDVAVAIIRFTSGALATLHASTTVYPDLGVRLHVHGTAGSAVIEGDDLAFFHALDAEDGEWKANQAHLEVSEAGTVASPRGSLDPSGSHASQYGNSHATQWADVVAAIREHRAPWVTLDDGLRALATVRAVYLSATLGKPVRVTDVLDGVYDDVATRTGSSDPVPADQRTEVLR